MKRKTLIVPGKTVRSLVSAKEAVRQIEKAFKCLAEGKTQMPPKVYIHLDKYNGDFRSMPAYMEGMEKCGIKWVNVHPDNRRKGIPTVMGVMILSDPSNGLPLCIMDATYATALRTGAAGAVAAKYLARKNSNKIALVGCGAQALLQLECLDAVFRIKEVNVWGRTRDERNNFKKKILHTGKFNIETSGDIKYCVEGADIIVTTTPSRKPIVKFSWLTEGAHINAIGADARGKQELSGAILKKARVVVDEWGQASHSGEINVPLRTKQISRKDIYAEISEIVTGKKNGRANNKEITVFDSTGLAVQDIAIADLVYKKAKKLKSVKSIKFN